MSLWHSLFYNVGVVGDAHNDRKTERTEFKTGRLKKSKDRVTETIGVDDSSRKRLTTPTKAAIIKSNADSWTENEGLGTMIIAETATDSRNKRAFAEALLRYPGNPYEAGTRAFPHDLELATFATSNWVFDPEVSAIQQQLVTEHGAREFLPTREDAARLIYDRANACHKFDDFQKGMKLYCDVMGFIEKPGVNVSNTQITVQPVMKVPFFETEDDWEANAVVHQSKLKNLTLEGRKVEGNELK